MTTEKPPGNADIGSLSTPEVRDNGGTKTAPRRCVNTVYPRGLADWIGVD